MSKLLAILFVLLACAGLNSAFVPSTRNNLQTSKRAATHTPLKMTWLTVDDFDQPPTPEYKPSRPSATPPPEDDEDAPAVVFNSAVLSPEEERRQARERMKKMVEEDKGVYQKADKNFGASDFSTYVNKGGDVEFDGGDGQTGVVGDGTNNMETFDERSVVKGSTYVTESKSRQRNAWGSGSTGYADKLKEQGMVDIDLKGTDRMQVRRQQLENYANQMNLKRAQDAAINQLELAEGKKQVRSAADYKDALMAGNQEEEKWNVYRPEKTAAEDVDFGPVEAGRIRQEFEINGKGDIKIDQRNIVMTYQPFRAAFVPGTSGAWVVRPQSGELERRGGEPTPLTVMFRPEVAGTSEDAYLVVDTEEFKHTYKITGHS